MRDRIIISICGPAGAGKTALAKKLVDTIGRDLACRVPADYFLKSYSDENFEEFISTPFKYDWNLLTKILQSRMGTECETPDFDFNKMRRSDKTGGITFFMRRYIVLDSMLPFLDSNYIIKLDASSETRLKRIKERDKAQSANSFLNWKKMEVTAGELDSGKYKFNLLLTGEEDADVNVAKLVEFLQQKGLAF